MKIRRIRSVCLAVLLLTPAVLPVSGCAEDEEDLLNPSGQGALWIGQSLSGRVVAGTNRAPVSGAAVVFRVSLDEEFWFTLASGTSALDGSYRLSAAVSGNPGRYWILLPPEGGPSRYEVHFEIAAAKAGVGQGAARSSFQRVPSAEPPVNPAPYQLAYDVILVPDELN